MAAGSDLLDDVFFNTEVDEKVVSDLVGSLESELSGAAAGRGGGAAAVRGVQSAVNHTGSPAGACGNNNNPDVQGTKMGLLSQQDLAKAAGTGGGVQGGVNNNNTARSHAGGSAVDGAGVAGGTTTSAAVRRLPGSMIMTAAVQQSHAAKTVTVTAGGGVVVSVAAKPGGTPAVQTLNGSNVVLNSHVVPGGGDRGGVGNSLPAGTAVNNGPATTGSPVSKGNVLLATTSNAVIQPSSMPNVIASPIMSPQPAVLNSVPTTTMPGVPATVHGVPTTVPGVPTVTLVRPPMQTPTITSPSGANNPATMVLTTPSVSGPAGTTAMVNRFDSPKTIIQTAGQVAAPVVSTGAMSAVKNATVLQNVRTSVPSTVAATCAAGIRAIAPQVLAPRLTQPQQGTPNIQNFQLPPGMVLVRSESGQLLMIHQQALAQTLAQSQSQSAMTPRPATPTSTPPVQITSVQAPGLIARQMSPNCIIKQGSAVQTTVQATTTLQRPPVLQNAIMLGGTASTPGQPLGTPTAMQPGAAATALTQRVPMAPTQISAETLENVKKCKNFLSTLIKLASSGKQSSETTANVKELVKNLLEAKIEAEDFTSRLYRELNSSPQPYLVPFLKRSLPALRQLTPDSSAFIHQSQLPPPTPQPAAAASSALTAVVLRPPLATNTTMASTAAGTKAPVVSLTQTPHSKPGLVPASQQPGTMVRPQVTLAQSPMVTLRGQSHSRIIMSQPQVVKQLQTTVVKPSLAPGIKAVTGVQSSLNAAQKNKLKEGGGGAFRDDDDINDVASMAGVNLSEESARILATNSELVGTVTRSCKDEAFLSSSLLTRRVLEIGKKFGVGELGPEVINLISHATQQRLQNVLEKVSQVAQQKNITFKEDERHEQISDVRAQLKFFEQLDQMEKQRKEEQEREILMKAAKSRSRQEDPEQLRLKQKAKEMQQQELAQIRQREANLTALAAIGPRKKRKADSPASSASAEGSGSSSSQSGGGSSVGGSRQFTRQRITRVNLRDLLFCLENERGASHSHLLYRGFLK